MTEKTNSQNQLLPVKRNKMYYPVSFNAQQGYWLINNLKQSKPAHHQSLLYKITGAIDTAFFMESIINVIDRHEVFHTAFSLEGDEPLLSINHAKTNIQQINLENYHGEEQNKEVLKIITTYINTPFNLSKGNLIRVAFIKLREDEYLLLFVQHIIITDNKSDEILLRDLLEIYKAKTENRTPALPELSIQYLDYILWRTKSLQGKMLEREIAFWKKTLDGASSYLSLATDFPRLNLFKKKRDSSLYLQLPDDLRLKLKPLIQKLGISLATFFLSLYKIILYYYSYQTDILVGIPYSNRTRKELQDILGNFVNTLIVRTKLDPALPFSAFAKQVNMSSLSAYAHGNLPLEKIIDIVKPKRNILYSPLIQVLFNFEYGETVKEEKLQDSKIERLSYITEEFNYDLHLAMKGNIEHAIEMYLVYNGNLFMHETIVRMGEFLFDITRSLIENPDLKISELNLLRETEQAYILNTFINKNEHKLNTHLVELFEKNVKELPHKQAIYQAGKSITYKELNRQANRLAHFLKKNHWGNGTAIGIYMDYSIDAFISLLAVLKAGAIYFFIPPEEPIKGIESIIQDAGGTVVITHASHSSLFASLNIKCVKLDTEYNKIQEESDMNPEVEVQSMQTLLAGLVYFPGRNNKPVGINLTHESLLAECKMASESMLNDMPTGDVYSGFFTSFPIEYAHRLLVQLLDGYSLVLLDENILKDSAGTIWPDEYNNINVIECNTSLIKKLLKSDFLKTHKSCVKRILIYGDVAGYDELGYALRNEKEIDFYFITRLAESTANLSVTKVTEELRKPTLGYPTDSTQVYILDNELRFVPSGFPGRLYIAGSGVAKGYRHNPELTKRQFIANPFANNSDELLFDTGFIGRYHKEGMIEILKTANRTVVLAGHTIDLNIIESTLKTHPDVNDCYVYVDKQENDTIILVAYLVVSGKIKQSALQQYMSTLVPPYMVPTLFIPVENILRTQTGEVSQSDLPPYEKYLDQENVVLAPKDPIERAISNMFSQIFKIEKVGSNSSFFKLGGHSLAAAQLIAKIRNDYNVEIDPQQAFEAETVSNLARLVTDVLNKKQF